jgi:hypothetical protein
LTSLIISLAVRKKAVVHPLNEKGTKIITVKEGETRRKKLLPALFADVPFVSKKSRG